MFGNSMLELIVVGMACTGVSLLGAGIVVSLAMPLRNSDVPDRLPPV